MKYEPLDTPSLTKLQPKHHSREAPTRQQCNYHYEEFTSAHERNARIETLRSLNIADGLQKITSQRKNKIVWILAIPKRCSL